MKLNRSLLHIQRSRLLFILPISHIQKLKLTLSNLSSYYAVSSAFLSFIESFINTSENILALNIAFNSDDSKTYGEMPNLREYMIFDPFLKVSAISMASSLSTRGSITKNSSPPQRPAFPS